jgi:hypothetical protein
MMDFSFPWSLFCRFFRFTDSESRCPLSGNEGTGPWFLNFAVRSPVQANLPVQTILATLSASRSCSASSTLSHLSRHREADK